MSNAHWNFSPRRLSIALGAAGLIAGITITSPVAAESVKVVGRADCGFAEKGPIFVEPGKPQHGNAVTCRLVGREVKLKGASVIVPPPGETIVLSGLGETASSELKVSVTLDGAMDIIGTESVASTAPGRIKAGALIGTNGCNQGNYSFTGGYVAGNYQYYRGDGATPAGAGAAAFADGIYRSALNITNTHNPCGIADGVGASFNYLGGTTTESDMWVSGTNWSCLGPGDAGDDSVNTVDYKPLPYIMQGAACARFGSGGNLLEADIRLNSARAWTYTGGGSCASQYDVEGVLTHEMGHVFGLNHVSQDDLTMYEFSRFCDAWQRSLGAGDANGMNAIY